MDRMVFTAMAAARQTQRLQALATNSGPYGHRRIRADLRMAMTLEVSGPGFNSRAVSGPRRGGGPTPGAIQQTGIRLMSPFKARGSSPWRPRTEKKPIPGGAFAVDPAGILRTADGRAVLGDGGLAFPFEQVLIGDDGTISVRPKGAGGAQLAQIGRLKLVNPPAEQVVKRPDGPRPSRWFGRGCGARGTRAFRSRGGQQRQCGGRHGQANRAGSAISPSETYECRKNSG